MAYTVALWASAAGRMVTVLTTEDILEAERAVEEGRKNGDLMFVYDKHGRSVPIPFGV